MQTLYATMQAMEICTMFMTFFPIFVILILIWFFFFLWKTQIAYFFFKDVITHATSSYFFCKSLRGLPESVCFVRFSHLTILEWWQWSRLTFNQSTKILILGFSLSFLKASIYSAQQENIWLWDRSHAPLKEGNGSLWNFFDLRP